MRKKLKIRYQAMLEADVYDLLEAVNKKARHRSLSQTINDVIRRYFKLIEVQSQQKTKKKPEKKDAITNIEEKYGKIKRYE